MVVPLVVRLRYYLYLYLSTAYKVFINSLLKLFEQYTIGSHIGSIYCGVPTVANDVTLIANDPLVGFIPFKPYNPAPIKAYTVFRAVCTLSETTYLTPNFDNMSLLIPK
jgi:hypothetical protein